MKKATTDNRRAGYKFQGMTTDELRRRREENQVEIRKTKREETLNKRRNLPPPPPTPSANYLGGDELALEEEQDSLAMVESVSTVSNASQLASLAQGIYGDDPEVQLRAMTGLRKALSTDRHDPPITAVLQGGHLPRIVQLLGEGGERVQFEAAWVLTNIASGTSAQTQAVVEAGAVPVLVQLLAHPSADVREQSVWALGNVAGDCPPLRDYCLQSDAMSPLLTILHQELLGQGEGVSRLTIVRNCTWAVSNLCRGKPSPSWLQVAPALPVLSALLYRCMDEECLADACWALSYLSDGPNNCIAEVIQSGVVARLVQLLSLPVHTVQTPALRALGNIVTGDDQQTQAVIDAGFLQAVAPLLSASTRSALAKEACWAVSNVTAGTPSQIDQVLEANLAAPLIQLLAHGEFKVKKEACWALSNATSGHASHPHQVLHLVEQGLLSPLIALLACQENKTIQVALDGLDNILSVGEKIAMDHPDGVNNLAIMVEEAGGLDAVYRLQHHNNHVIYAKAKNIIDKYYGRDEDEEAAQMAMPTDFHFAEQQPPQGGFSF